MAKLKKEDIDKVKKRINGEIARQMQDKSPRFSIEKDRKKEVNKNRCREKGDYYGR